jgi:WD40 repeat protein
LKPRWLTLLVASALAAGCGGGDATQPQGATGKAEDEVRFRSQGQRALLKHGGEVRALAWARDSSTLATGGADKTVQVWNATNGQSLASYLQPDEVHAVAITGGATMLAAGVGPPGAGGGPGKVLLWDVVTGKRREESLTLDGTVRGLALSNDARTLAVAALKKEFGDRLVGQSSLWDASTLKPKGTLSGHGAATATAVVYSPDSKLLASAGADGVVVWELGFWKKSLCTIRTPEEVVGATFSPDTRLLLTVGKSGGATFWEPRGGQELGSLKVGGVTAAAFGPDGKNLALGTKDGVVVLWDLLGGKEHTRLGPHGGQVSCVGFSPDGKLLASGSLDRNVFIWDVATAIPAKGR